ncbi:MAG: transketolase C-terminal domain-containing protein [Legionellaceae bacterium]|nr:transketolase C-terminal domain-containing protein [Legionellaceae bacterium]
MRKIKYTDALSEGLVQAMDRDLNLFVTGISVDYSAGAFGTTTEALKKFPTRVFDAPSMENALTGIAIGAAAMGKRPIIYHPRNDFMFLALDQMINLAAKWKYMYAGNAGNMPLVVRTVVGKGWGQGATHSQSLHSILAHFPGLHVVMPATPSDAKGLLIAATQSTSPVVIIEHRALYNIEGEVSEEYYSTPIGKANTLREGKDITIVATSLMVQEALIAAENLEKEGVDVEVVDIRSIRPLDETAVLRSIEKTGHLLVIDTSWELCGFASEIAALAAEKGYYYLKGPVRRMSLANCPAPVSYPLETAFYPKPSNIAKTILTMLGKNSDNFVTIDKEDTFKGPY